MEGAVSTENILKPLILHQNKANRNCLSNKNKIRSSKENYEKIGDLWVIYKVNLLFISFKKNIREYYI